MTGLSPKPVTIQTPYIQTNNANSDGLTGFSGKNLRNAHARARRPCRLKLTYDFMQLIMQQGDQVEILEPKKLRDQMRNLAKTLTSYYK